MHTLPTDINFDRKRITAIEELGKVTPHLDLDTFYQLLPRLRAGIDPVSFVKKLQDNGAITKGGRWWGYTKIPLKMVEHEDVVFERLQTYAHAIAAAAPVGHQPTLSFHFNPTAVAASSTRSNTSRPDYYGLLRAANSNVATPEWINIALAGEFRERESRFEINDVSRT